LTGQPLLAGAEAHQRSAERTRTATDIASGAGRNFIEHRKRSEQALIGVIQEAVVKPRLPRTQC
jgi:hypothetical protein